MKHILNGRSLLFAVALAALGSCSVESPWRGGDAEGGYISLKLSTDYSVKTSTRASDSESPVKPDGERFRIKLESSDGSYSKEWENLDKFNNEESFPKGSYKVTASYGSEEEQGFRNPYYVGAETVTVVAGETSEHSVTATLANSMVSIRYTESFMNYFSQYSAALVSEGISDPVVFARGEDRPAYVKPGNVTVNFNITSSEGQEVTVSPASFTALPRRHYIITANVSETTESGQFALNVEFDETVEFVEQEIILSDELFSTPAPKVIAQGFSFGDVIETYESVDLPVSPQFQIIAEGGLSEAKFTVESSNSSVNLPVFGSEVDLMNVDAVTQQLVEQSHLNCYGFFRRPTGENADENVKMGVIDMKEFIENLNPDDYTFALSVKDKLGRVFEYDSPVSVSAKVKPIIYKIEAGESPKFMSDELSVFVSTNYAGAKDEFTITSEDPDGNLVPTIVKSVEEVNSSDAVYPVKFHYILKVDDIDDTDWRVEVEYPKKEPQVVDIPVIIPEYDVEVDAFARRALIKIVPKNDEDREILVNKARLYWENKSDVINATQISLDSDSGIITITGLESGKTYDSIGLSYGSKIGSHCYDIKFTTESEADVPNGDFSSATGKLTVKDLQVGGQYNVAPANYTLKSSIDRNLPDGWATINEFTCFSGSQNKNTWFLVPSTYSEEIKDDNGNVKDYKVVVRNVGYNHDGVTPSRSGGAFNTKYYCENAPSEAQLNKKAGELFLGSYSFNGNNPDRTNGISFSSRPSFVEFDYEYEALAGDKGDIVVKVIDVKGDILAEGKIDLTDSGQTTRHCSVPLTGYSFGSKASTLYICFRSSSSDNPPINIPTGSALNESQSLGNRELNANSYHAVATGSVLKVDNVKLGYE